MNPSRDIVFGCLGLGVVEDLFFLRQVDCDFKLIFSAKPIALSSELLKLLAQYEGMTVERD